MRSVLKWGGLVLGGLLALVLVAVIGLSVASASRLNKKYDVQAPSIALPADEEALARGAHLTAIHCQDCHGADLTGGLVVDDPALGMIYASNLTGLAETYSTEDLVLAIRHGLSRDGRPLMIMPSESFIHFSEADLAAVVAHLRSIPRSGEDVPPRALGPVGRLLVGAGLLNSGIPATYIDHEMEFPIMPLVGEDSAYGEYMARFCQACHGADLTGGKSADPSAPPAPDLTPGGELATWSEDDFIAVMRTGVTPDGRQLDPAFMPWPSVGKHSDVELRALWRYLSSLPAGTTASR